MRFHLSPNVRIYNIHTKLQSKFVQLLIYVFTCTKKWNTWVNKMTYNVCSNTDIGQRVRQIVLPLQLNISNQK